MRDTLSDVGSLLPVTASQVVRAIMLGAHAPTISARIHARRPSKTLMKGEGEEL
jgi:hypothetical protein